MNDLVWALANAIAPAMSGLLTLVPPTSVQPASGLENPAGSLYESATDTGVCGLATAAMSSLVRCEQPVSVCHAGLGSKALQPLPVPPHAVSDHPRELAAWVRAVPPTAITYGEASGVLDFVPFVAGGDRDRHSRVMEVGSHSLSRRRSSLPPQLLLISVAPSATASFSDVYRLVFALVFASTSRMWHLGQAAETMSRSGKSPPGIRLQRMGRLCPRSDSTFLKQPLPVVQGPIP